MAPGGGEGELKNQRAIVEIAICYRWRGDRVDAFDSSRFIIFSLTIPLGLNVGRYQGRRQILNAPSSIP